MRFIRHNMRSAVAPALSVPQLRALLFVKRNPGVSLSPVADHLGIRPAAASGLVDRLVRQEMLDRTTDPTERRRIRLTLTKSGTARLEAASAATRKALEARFEGMPEREAATIERAMRYLRERLGDDR
jgi:DNA-binding MarR family transcriptional regulator